MIGCLDRTRKYQKEFEIGSHNVYTQVKNKGTFYDHGKVLSTTGIRLNLPKNTMGTMDIN